jgi:hypothetical protein
MSSLAKSAVSTRIRALLAFASVAMFTPLCAAQVSPLYMTTHGNGTGTVYVAQGGIITRQWTAPDAAGSLVVTGNTVRTAGNGGGPGREFTLAGAPTGITFPTPATTGLHVDDSTTDGQYIYGFAYFGQTLTRFNMDWSNPTPVFTVSPLDVSSGVTFDPLTGGFWISEDIGGVIRRHGALGQVQASFGGPQGGGRRTVSLALDPADNTLWVFTEHPFLRGELHQYTRTGQFLQTVGGLHEGISGIEFQTVVPSPGAAAIVALGGAVMAGRRRRSRRR